MATPTTTALAARVPAGIKLGDGYKSVKAFSLLPTLSVWEIDNKPPAPDGGEPVNTTTMYNTTYESMAPQTLVKHGPSTCKCAFDPNVYNQLLTIQNKNKIANTPSCVTDHLPDGSTLDYFGYLQKADIDPLERGKMPTMTLTVVCTNWDPINNAESGPVLTSVAGT